MDSAALAKQHKEAFDRDGFVVIRGFYSPAELAELTAHMDWYVREVVPKIPAGDAFYEIKGEPSSLKQMQRMTDHDPYFDKLRHNDRFTKLAQGLFGRGAETHGVEWFNKPARIGKATPPHQDGYYFMLEPNEALTFWLALDPVDESNGCIRYIPGSHLRGVRSHGRTQTLGFSQGITDYGPGDETAEVKMILKPGDLLAHHSLTIHRADANASPRERRALGLVYYSDRAKPDKEKQEAYQARLLKDLAATGKI